MQMDFTYNSNVKWKYPGFIESTVENSQIFDELKSTWIIRPKLQQEEKKKIGLKEKIKRNSKYS